MNDSTSHKGYFVFLCSFFLFFSGYANTTDSLLIKITDESTSGNYENTILISETYQKEGNHALALTFLKKALKIASELQNDDKIARVNEALGDLYLDVHDYENSTGFYLKAQTIYETKGLSVKTNQVQLKIGKVYLRIGKEKDAITLFRSLQSKLKENNQLNELEQIYYFLGIAYGNQERADSSLFCFKKSRELAEQMGPDNKLRLAGIYNNIGALQSQANNAEQALENYGKALDLFDEIKNPQGKGVTFGNIAYVHQKEKNYDKALQFYDSTIFYLDASNRDNIFYLNSIYLNISNLYKEVGPVDSAFAYFEKYVTTSDSLANIETVEKVTELEKKFELNKKDRELDALEKENQNKIEQQYLLIILVILLLLILILVFFTMRTIVSKVKLKHLMLSNDKDRLEKELKYKNKEVEDFALRIIEKNKFLEQLNEDVKKIKLDGENAKKIKELTSNIKNNLYINRDRRDLEQRLDDIHKSFIHHLEEKIPNLTKSEKRLCTLLVMEMSSKDMATILNISLQGVKTARHRLRKKLNLSQEEDLTAFLKNL